MHMSDALLSPAVGLVMCAVSAGAIAYSVSKIKEDGLDEKMVPIMGVMGAFVFAAQMINFTIPITGSSGHIGGGVLLAALLGEFPAFLTISAVLIIQALFFADGGLFALGCNIFNMGFLACFIAYPLLFKPIIKKGLNRKNIAIASIITIVVSMQLGAFFVVIETLFSGITELPFGAFVAIMQPIHFAISLVEGLITAGVLIFIHNMRPEIMQRIYPKNEIAIMHSKKVLIILILLTLFMGGFLSTFASSYPDGLEWSMEAVAGTSELEVKGLIHDASQSLQDTISFMPDYDYRSADEGGSLTGNNVAGLAGGTLTFILAAVTGLLISTAKKKSKPKPKM